jgi:hypothetical protein
MLSVKTIAKFKKIKKNSLAINYLIQKTFIKINKYLNFILITKNNVQFSPQEVVFEHSISLNVSQFG